MPAGMNVTHKTFQPVGDELHRAPQQAAGGGGGHVVAVHVYLNAKRSPDIPAHHADLRLLQPEVPGQQVLHHVRRLGALIHREPRLALVPVGDDGAGLQRHAGVAGEAERRLDYLVRPGQGGIHLPGIYSPFPGQVAAQLRVYNR